MRFFQSLFAGAAFVAAAAALEINNYPSKVESGKTYTVTYSPADDTPTTFILRQGRNEDLSTLTTLTATAIDGTFEWTVSPDLPDASDYALQIQQGTDTVNYIGPVGLTGSDATSAISSSVAPSTVATSSTASSTASESTITSASLSVTSTASIPISSSAHVSSNITSVTLSTSATVTSTRSILLTTTAGLAESTGAAAALGASPMMAMFGAVAAMVYLN